MKAISNKHQLFNPSGLVPLPKEGVCFYPDSILDIVKKIEQVMMVADHNFKFEPVFGI